MDSHLPQIYSNQGSESSDEETSFRFEGTATALTAQSLEALIRGTKTPAVVDQSWTSSLATPLEAESAARRVNQLTTEERKVLLPSEDAPVVKTPSDVGSPSDLSSSRLSKRLFFPRRCGSPQDKKVVHADHSEKSFELSTVLNETDQDSLTNEMLYEFLRQKAHMEIGNKLNESGIIPMSPESFSTPKARPLASFSTPKLSTIMDSSMESIIPSTPQARPPESFWTPRHSTIMDSSMESIIPSTPQARPPESFWTPRHSTIMDSSMESIIPSTPQAERSPVYKHPKQQVFSTPRQSGINDSPLPHWDFKPPSPDLFHSPIGQPIETNPDFPITSKNNTSVEKLVPDRTSPILGKRRKRSRMLEVEKQVEMNRPVSPILTRGKKRHRKSRKSTAAETSKLDFSLNLADLDKEIESKQLSEQPSTSKCTFKITEQPLVNLEQPSTSKCTFKIKEHPSEQPVIKLEQPSTSKCTVSSIEQPSTSKCTFKMKEQPSEQPVINLEQPSTSKCTLDIINQPSIDTEQRLIKTEQPSIDTEQPNIESCTADKLDELKQQDLQYDQLDKDIANLVDSNWKQVSETTKSRGKQNLQQVVQNIIENSNRPNILYKTVVGESKVSRSELERPVLDMERAIILTSTSEERRKSTQNEPVAFSKLIEDEDSHDEADLELFVHLLEADQKFSKLEALKSKVTPVKPVCTPVTKLRSRTSTPMVKVDLPQCSETPIPKMGLHQIQEEETVLEPKKLFGEPRTDGHKKPKMEPILEEDNTVMEKLFGSTDTGKIVRESALKIEQDMSSTINDSVLEETNPELFAIHSPSVLEKMNPGLFAVTKVKEEMNPGLFAVTKVKEESNLSANKGSVFGETNPELFASTKVEEESCSIDDEMLEQVEKLEESAIKSLNKVKQENKNADFDDSDMDHLLVDFCETAESALKAVKAKTLGTAKIAKPLSTKSPGLNISHPRTPGLSTAHKISALKSTGLNLSHARTPGLNTSAKSTTPMSHKSTVPAFRSTTPGLNTSHKSTVPAFRSTTPGLSKQNAPARKRKADENLENIPKQATIEVSGFRTGRGTDVKISEKSLEAAKSLFADLDNSDGELGFRTASGHSVAVSEQAMQAAKKIFDDPDLPSTNFSGFSTASGKNVAVSEKALLEAKKIFEDPDTTMSKFSGFSTASGKNVAVSEKALQEAKKIFDDPDTTTFSGFSTASGKTVAVSEKALHEAKKIFEDPDTTMSNFSGFSTASWQKVSVSEKALLEAKKIFEDPDTTNFSGFSTTGGKNVAVSERAMQQAKKLFEDSDTTNFSGFSTASGKNVAVSEKALLEAKAIFEDPDLPSTNFSGFSTASGKNVAVSENALLEAKKLFEDPDLPSTNFSGFSTASGKNVSVSEKVLLEAKKLFDDSTMPPVNEEKNVGKVKHSISDPETNSPPRKQLKSSEPRSPVLSRYTARKRKPFEVARESQGKLIELKSKQTGPYVAGKFWKIRNEGTTLKQLRDLPGDEHGECRSEVCHVTSRNAAEFKFKLDDIVHCEGTMLIPNNDGDLGVMEMQSALLASPGVYRKLIPHSDWVRNHYRWIVWKLASLERRFPVTLAGHLSVQHVLLQLKFRYNCEIDLAQRSPVLKITTKDASPAGRMVLCVAEIHSDHLILTDSWYPIRTKIDDEMKRLIGEGKIVEGTKLMIHGAELEGNECLPLQQPDDMCLKISTNSTRRARWWAKLQFYSGGPMRIDLGSVLPYGGTVGAMECAVTKVYPMVYAEKTVDGRTVMRGERAEKLEASRAEDARQKLLERIVAEERARIKQEQDREALQRRKSSNEDESMRYDGEWLCLALQADPDLQSSLTESQCALALEWSRDERDRWSALLDKRVRERASSECPARTVSPLLKVRLSPMDSAQLSAVLSIWRPDLELSACLRESTVVGIFGAVASGKRCGDLCLNSVKSTKILPSSHLSGACVRHVTPIGSLDEPDFKPQFNEVDLVGIVTKIEPMQCNNLQCVILCDSIGYQVVVCFWGGIESHGLSQLLIPGVSIAASNLQWRRGSKRQLSDSYSSLPSLHASETSSFSREPTETYLQEALQKLRATLDPEMTMKNLKKCLTPATQKPVDVERPVSQEVRKRLSALAKYGEPPPLSPLPGTTPSRLCQSFNPPSKISQDQDSPPLSLSQ